MSTQKANVPSFTMRQLLDAGVHFGHKTLRWNPRMAPYLYGERNGIHVIDLQQTVPMLHHALKTVYEVASKNGRVLFVGTKRQASDHIAAAASRCGMYYVNNRWLGGMLTNWHTVSESIKTLKAYEDDLNDPEVHRTKKERLEISRQRDKLERSLGGIKSMGGLPDLLFVIDTNKEDLAVTEAVKLGIPVIGIVDSNSNPDPITYPVPGNDDATRSIALYCQLVSDAVLAGIEAGLASRGIDVGSQAEPSKEKSGKSGKAVPLPTALPKEEESLPIAKTA